MQQSSDIRLSLVKEISCARRPFSEESFSTAGGGVAILTFRMRRYLPLLAVVLASSLSATAQNWSLGVHSGPFVFGDFVERRVRPAASGEATGTVTMTLSAATRAGLAVDLERELAPRWALRLEGTFTNAPLAVKEDGDEGVALDAGEVDVSTFTLPLVFRVNPRGALRFHLMGGPAYALYRVRGTPNVSGITPLDETSGRFGLAVGGGAAWWVRERFAVEGNLSDVVTSSPFDREDFPSGSGWSIPRPHNVHTTLGARWRF
jgi:opacity protein-like surface antigen